MQFLAVVVLVLASLAAARPTKRRHGKRCLPSTSTTTSVTTSTPDATPTSWTTIWIESTISSDPAPTTSTTPIVLNIAPSPTTTSSPPPVIVISSSSPPPAATSAPASPSTDDSTISQYLTPQNTERALYGASPLTWNNTLAAAAQEWANNCVFQHSGGTLGPFGENLSAGTGDFGIGAGIQLWLNEASQYDASNPQPSHFTQVVWKSTTEVGCAVAVCDNIFSGSSTPANFYVCEYFPQGNVIGYFPENVGSLR